MEGIITNWFHFLYRRNALKIVNEKGADRKEREEVKSMPRYQSFEKKISSRNFLIFL